MRSRAGWLLALAALIAINIAVFGVIRSSSASYWPTLKLHTLGPFDGFPLVRSNFLLALGGVLTADFALLGRRSAVARLLGFSRSERVDIVLFVVRLVGLGYTVPVLLTAGLISFTPIMLAEWRSDVLGWLPTVPRLGNQIAQVVLYTTIVDFLRYWWHRWMHRSPVLWPFHEVHHSATSFTILTGDRVHPIEYVFALPTVVFPLVLLGATPGQSLVAITVLRIVDFAQHSMVGLNYGWLGRWVIYSPVGHRIHHSPEPEHWDTN